MRRKAIEWVFQATNKRNLTVPADHRVKLKEREKRDKNQNLARKMNNTMEYESDGDTNSNWRARNNTPRIGLRDWKA